MVIAAASWALALGLLAAGEPEDPVRSALAKGQYPWYDAQADALEPVTPPSPERFEDAPDIDAGPLASLGQIVVFTLMVAALAALIALLAWAWARYHPDPDAMAERSRSAGASARLTSLPTGLQVDLTDPLGEARRLRAAGDLSGAVICLFVHQLVLLDRLGQLRLAPGRTARQLVRSIPDRQARRWVEPTLRLFEAVYYGHLEPEAEAFEAAWADAEALERWAASGVTP